MRQNLAEKDKFVERLEQELANEQEKRLATKNNLSQERQTNHNLRQRLRNEQETNAVLTQKLHAYEQNYSNLLNNHQITLKAKAKTEKQLNNLVATIKTAAKQLRHDKN